MDKWISDLHEMTELALIRKKDELMQKLTSVFLTYGNDHPFIDQIYNMMDMIDLVMDSKAGDAEYDRLKGESPVIYDSGVKAVDKNEKKKKSRSQATFGNRFARTSKPQDDPK